MNKVIYGMLVLVICSIGVYGFDSMVEQEISMFTTEICEFKSNNGVPGLLIWSDCMSDVRKELELDIYRGDKREEDYVTLSKEICGFISLEGMYDIDVDECINKYSNILNS